MTTATELRHEIRARSGVRRKPQANKRSAAGAALAAVLNLDVSVSHADRRFPAPAVEADESPLGAALVAMAALGDVSLCTPARPIRSAS
jgi:hypothetical protein